MPRIFVAIRLPDRVAAALAGAFPPDLPGLRPVDPALLHLTLAFVGTVPEDHVAGVTAAGRAAARRQRTLELRIEGIGRFPSHGRVQTVWAGIAGDLPALAGLAERVRAELAKRDLPFDPKPFRPHLTLGRVRPSATDPEAQAIASAVAAAQVTAGLSFSATGLDVTQSRLSPKGPRYSSRATIAFV